LFQIYTFSYRRVSNSGKGDATSTPVLLAEVLSAKRRNRFWRQAADILSCAAAARTDRVDIAPVRQRALFVHDPKVISGTKAIIPVGGLLLELLITVVYPGIEID
jgi:hypothetical protein